MSVSRVAAGADTICALATSSIRGGIGIVRISGSGTRSVLRGLGVADDRCVPRHMVFTRFRSKEQFLDEGFVVWLPGPKSYTGEDTAEIHGHGGAQNLGRLVRAVVAAGARVAEPGEFTLRAFLNGRLDLAQAEAVLDVIDAPTETALELAHKQLQGTVSASVGRLHDALLDVQAGLEVQIDFSDEDLGEALVARYTAALEAVAQQLDAMAATFGRGRLLRSGATVLLAGAPNAGKSSLFNALLRQSRSIVTPIPGTTRDFIEERVDLGGLPIVLIDTAGLRDDSGDEVEAQGMERTRALAERADVVLWLDDPTAGGVSPVGPESLGLRDLSRVVRLRTKADLRVEHEHEHEHEHEVSALTGFGIRELEDRLRRLLLAGVDGTTDTGAVLTHARHYEAVVQASRAVHLAVEASRAMMPPDLISVDVQEATYQLGLVVGTTTTEDILDRIFSRFCIGK